MKDLHQSTLEATSQTMSSQSSLPTQTYPVFDWRLPQTTFFLVWLIFFGVVTIFSGTWYYLRRDIQPIKARLPILNSIANFVNIFITALVCFNRILASTFPCDLDQYQGYIYLFLGTIYAIRCWVLYFRFMWTQEVATCQDLMKMGSTLTGIGRRHQSTRNLGGPSLMPSAHRAPQGLWYSRHLYLISPWFLTVLYIITMLLLMIPPTVAVGTGNVIDHGGQSGTRCEGISSGWETLIYMAYVSFYIYLAFRLAPTFDYFHIKDELKTLALFVVPMFILWIVSSFVFRDYQFPISTLVSLCILAFAQAMSTLYPLYLSFYQVPKLEKNSTDVTSFDGLLRSETGFNSFKTFLEGEFAIENLLFFQTAEDFKEVAILTINHHLKSDPSGARKDEESLKEGFLTKKGGPMNAMRRRYLVLKPGLLLIYAKKSDQDEEVKLDLSSGVKCRELPLKPGDQPFEFYIQLPSETKKKHVFGAQDAKQRELWRQALKSASKPDRESDDEEDEKEDNEGDLPEQGRQIPAPSAPSPHLPLPTSSLSISEQKEIPLDRDDDDMISSVSGGGGPIPIPPRRAPRGYQTRHSLHSGASSAEIRVVPRDSTLRVPSTLKKGDGGPRPLLGAQWRVELLAYALEMFFVYIEEDGFAQVNLSNPVMTHIARTLKQSVVDERSLQVEEKSQLGGDRVMGGGLSLGVTTIVGQADQPLGIEDEPDLEHGRMRAMESSKTVPEDAQGIDLQSVVNLAAKIEKDIDVEALPTLFSDAQEEIFNLMQSDSFRRYIRSHLYRDFVEKEKKHRANIEAMHTTALYS